MNNATTFNPEQAAPAKDLSEVSITYGTCVTNPNDISIRPLGEILSEIKSDSVLKSDIQKIRNTTEKAELKKKLPYFVAAILRGHRNKESFESTEILIFDLDHLNKYDLDRIRKEIEQWRFTSAVFTSPSGEGLKLIIRLNRIISNINEYYEVYSKMIDYLNKQFNIYLDHSTCDPARACFLSYDPDVYINENAEKFDISGLPAHVNNIVIDRPSAKRTEMLQALEGVSEGERHNSLTKVIGFCVSKGFDKDFTKQIAYSSNQVNNPPYTDSEFESEFNSIYNSFAKSESVEIPFKILIKHKVQINSAKLIEFIQEGGFCKVKISDTDYALSRIQKGIIENVGIDNIIEFVKNYLETSSDRHQNIVLDILIKGNSIYLNSGAMKFLPIVIPTLKRGNKETAYLYFKNSYIEITTSEISVYDYSDDSSSLIRKNSIIPRSLNINQFKNDSTPSVYSTMVSRICRNDKQWIKALSCAIGYVLHDYKDRATTKAIIFCDEEIPASDASNGGTGKSLVCEAIRHCRNTITIDGKNLKTDSAFVFQQINNDTEEVIIDDARKTFDFESLFSVITSDLTVEKKHQHPYTIPFTRSPKFLITTNYTIKGSGNSLDRRKHEIEFSNYYNKKHTPLDDFGHRLFEDWDDLEWTRFYKTMAEYIQNYLRCGLVKYEVRNLKIRRVIDATCMEFFDFAQDNIKAGIEYNKKTLLNKFQGLYPEYSQYKGKTFDRWLKEYADTFDFKVVERRSNVDRFITFIDDAPAVESVPEAENDGIDDDNVDFFGNDND